ncbi:unnamed protein product, partial [Prunus brigantina]
MFIRFHARVEKESGKSIKAFHTDRGGEFNSHEFTSFCEMNGIQRHLTTPYTPPKKNGVAERKNHTIMNMEAWGEHKLAVDHFRIFGCIRYAHIPNEKKSKLDDKGVKCVFIGVSEESKGYKLYNPITQKAIISRDVLFDEDNTWDWNSKEKRSISVDLNEGDESRIDRQLQSHGLALFQLDVKSTFLHGDLKEQIFVDQALGYVQKGNESKVYRLKKALYGLKQAPRAWYSRIDAYFTKVGFHKCPYEHTIFIKIGEGGKIMIVCLYVDDLIFIGNDETMFAEFKK